MPSRTRKVLDAVAWVLLWIVICGTPSVFWLSLWMLLPPTVFVALLSVGPVAGGLVTCWYALSGTSRPGRTQRPAVPSGLSMVQCRRYPSKGWLSYGKNLQGFLTKS